MPIPKDNTFSGKTYDSATAYDKAQYYYGGLLAGNVPSLSEIDDVQPSLAEFVSQIGEFADYDSLRLYDTNELYDTHFYYEYPGYTGYMAGVVPSLEGADDPMPQLEIIL